MVSKNPKRIAPPSALTPRAGISVPEHSYVLRPEDVTGAVHRVMFPMRGTIGPIFVQVESVIPEKSPFTITMSLECEEGDISMSIEGKAGLNKINLLQPVAPCDKLCVTVLGASTTLHGVWVAYVNQIKRVGNILEKELGAKNEGEPATPPIEGSPE